MWSSKEYQSGLSNSGKFLIQRPTYVPVIAEIGINHNGDLKIAKALIEMAHKAGCDAVKFQKRDITTVYSKEILDSPRESPWGNTQRDQKLGLEFGPAEYSELRDFSRSKGLGFSASAWDLASADFVESLEPEFHKVASAMITNIEFLERIASYDRLTFISTGMADIEMVDRALGQFKSKMTNVVLMHTVSTYPSPEEDLNLLAICSLAERYGLPVGYSGHESSVTPSLVAVALGAAVVERHITLDRTMYGSDQSASLEENGLKALVDGVRKIPSTLGDGIKKWQPGEEQVASKLRYW
jgi:N-acetylneuraminate synthase